MIHGYLVEILRTRGTAIEVARVRPVAETVSEPASAGPSE
jgi:hypothetical protein